MTDTALKEFEQARREQGDRNEARNIRKHVNQARDDTHGAGARWPFELTQNAHDPGPRDGKTGVDIDLAFDGHAVLYEHDGKLFTMPDLAALLSGGSSKEFDAKAFLVSLKEGQPRWNLIGREGIEKLPAIQWKLMNIQKIDNKKHIESLENLKRKLGL